MEKSKKFRVYKECDICHVWQVVEKGPDNGWYCAIHLRRKKDEPIDKKRAKKGRKWLDDFRSMLNGPTEV
jgi:hypothetical protein